VVGGRASVRKVCVGQSLRNCNGLARSAPRPSHGYRAR
jgi:hypothetical protein